MGGGSGRMGAGKGGGQETPEQEEERWRRDMKKMDDLIHDTQDAIRDGKLAKAGRELAAEKEFTRRLMRDIGDLVRGLPTVWNINNT